VKKFRFAFSVLLVPAFVVAGGGGGGSTCCTAGSLNLPASVSGVQTPLASGASTYTMTLSGITGSSSLSNQAYSAFCSNPNAPVPSTIVPAVNPLITYSVYNSYNFLSLPHNDSNIGFGSDDQSTTADAPASFYKHTLEQEWSAVNYVINNPNKIPANAEDVQVVIWEFLHPETGIDYLTLPNIGLDSYAVSLYNDAVAHGLNFVPASGQLTGVILDPGTTYQGVIIPVTICPQQCQCHCIKCSVGDHAHCVNTKCTDTNCQKSGGHKGSGW
jgi:hypothetical protein